jgi:hypothetical protein
MHSCHWLRCEILSSRVRGLVSLVLFEAVSANTSSVKNSTGNRMVQILKTLTINEI